MTRDPAQLCVTGKPNVGVAAVRAEDSLLKVGLIGAGRIGSRRAAVVSEDPKAALLMIADVVEERAYEVARRWGAQACEVTSRWEDVVENRSLDVIIVATVNRSLEPIAVAALQNDKNVLCEKPMGRNLLEAEEMAIAARATGRILKIGFNHRHYPGIRQAHELCFQGAIGPLFFIRCIYGHGGRLGYEKEWRGDPHLAGGGELLDQGVHVVDLCRWFLGEFTDVTAYTATYFWDLGRLSRTHGQRAHSPQLEDNAFVLMRTGSGQAAFFHTSWTQWKNRFLFEIYGRDGCVRVDGRGGSYGTQRLILERRQPEFGRPEETVWEFPGPDTSWEAEWAEFTSAIRDGRRPMGNEEDGLQAMRVIDAIYRAAEEGHPTGVPK